MKFSVAQIKEAIKEDEKWLKEYGGKRGYYVSTDLRREHLTKLKTILENAGLSEDGHNE